MKRKEKRIIATPGERLKSWVYSSWPRGVNRLNARKARCISAKARVTSASATDRVRHEPEGTAGSDPGVMVGRVWTGEVGVGAGGGLRGARSGDAAEEI